MPENPEIEERHSESNFQVIHEPEIEITIKKDREDVGVVNLGGVCGSDEIHMHPCDECDHVQFSTCFSCGETHHLRAGHHDPDCSKMPPATIVPLYDADLNPINRDDE